MGDLKSQYSKEEKRDMGKKFTAASETLAWRDRLYRAANLVIKIFGCILFAGLSWYAMRYTQFIAPEGEEIPLNVRDSMGKNLLGILLAGFLLIGLHLLHKKTNELVQYRIKMAALLTAMVWVGVLSFWWILSADRVPVGDQAFVYGAASYFRKGNYMFFGPGGYLGMYPYQLGLVALMEFLFLFAGAYNYFAFEVVCAFMAIGIVYLGYRIVDHIVKSMAAAVFYCISIMCCVPLILYTSWVYGDIPSIFFSLLAFHFLLKYDETKKMRWILFMTFAVTIAVLARQNSLIFVVAFGLAGAVHIIRHRDLALGVAILLAVAVPQFTLAGVYEMYEVRSGQEISDGIPSMAWVAMGLQKNWRGNGWYSDYHRIIYGQAEFNAELTAELAKQEIRRQLEIFKSSPSYTWDFFREKILSQWNQPLYQAVYFNTVYPEDNLPAADSIAHAVKTWRFSRILAFADRVQFIVFVGMFCYFAFGVKRNSNILHHIPAITMLGGFLFSAIWEAKARYMFPYFIMMFPFAAIGYWQLLQNVTRLYASKNKSDEEDNIIEFRKTA